MNNYSNNCFAIVNSIAKQFCVFSYFLIFSNYLSGQSNKLSSNIGSNLTLEKVISVNVPSILDGNLLKLKVRNGYIYLLNDDFVSNQGLILIREHIESNKRDTTFIKTNEFMLDVNDFDVNGDYLYIFLNNEIFEINLKSKISQKHSIKLPTNFNYRHFLNLNPETFIFYEWQIGQSNYEEKSTYKYYLTSKKWELLDSNKIDGLNFLAINKGNKYIDINENILIKFKPNLYQFIIKDLNSSYSDTIHRTFDSSVYISNEYLKDIHANYQRKSASYLFDSMDNHCYRKFQIRSARVSGDSIIYINFENKCSECEWFPGRKSTRYLDIWKYNRISNRWFLYLSDLRLDNQSICEKFDNSKLTKNMLFFTLLGVESEWCVYSNLFIIPKMMSDKIDLNGDLSLINRPESRLGSQNIQIFIFKID